MNNYINYYYNLYPGSIDIKNKKYYFLIGQDKYYFIPFNRPVDDIKVLLPLNTEMIKRNSLVHEIILNKNKEAITVVENVPYILLRVYVNENKKIDLSDILFMLDNNEGIIPNNTLNRMNWTQLWASKVDYFEYQIGHLSKKYPMLYKTIDYYIGLAENAISYVKGIEVKSRENIISPIAISHKRIYTEHTLFDLYNPINFIIDYKIRDISEYIKMSFFNNLNVWKDINSIFSFYRFSNYSLSLLYGRLLFPSYYFDIYEEIIENDLNENKILNVINKATEYERFLKDIYIYINNFYPIEGVEWIIKKHL